MYRNVVNDFLVALNKLKDAYAKGAIPNDELELVEGHLLKLALDITDNPRKITAAISSLIKMVIKK